MSGLMFPGITKVNVTRKSDGEVVVVSYAEMKAKLPPKAFDRLSHDVFMNGTYEDSKHKVTIHTQERDFDINNSFL